MFLKYSAKLSTEDVASEPTSDVKENPGKNEKDTSEVQGASTVPSEEEANRVAALEAECAATQAKLAETHDRMLRIAADFENTRKRMEKEKADTRIYSIQEFAKDLLPVIDAFDKAMSAIEQSQINFETEEGKKVAGIVEGVQLVSKVFQDTVKKHGIERLPGKRCTL